MHKIVVLDGHTLNPGDLSWKELESMGEVRIYDRTEAGDIIARIEDADIVLTNKTPLTGDTLKACPAIKYIGCQSTGYNVVDIKAANALGIKGRDACRGCQTGPVVGQSGFLLLEWAPHGAER